MPPNQSIPDGYTFANWKLMVSEGALECANDLLQKAYGGDNRNDQSNYSILTLIDKQLKRINTRITRKDWMGAWTLVEALFLFMKEEDSWPMVDAGDRVLVTNRAYGCAFVKIAKALQDAGELDLEHIPNLRYVLKNVASWGHSLNTLGGERCRYDAFARRVAKELGPVDKEQREEWIKAWLSGLPKDLKAMHTARMVRNREEDAAEAEEGEDEDSWMNDGDTDESGLDYTSAWKEYKENRLRR